MAHWSGGFPLELVVDGSNLAHDLLHVLLARKVLDFLGHPFYLQDSQEQFVHVVGNLSFSLHLGLLFCFDVDLVLVVGQVPSVHLLATSLYLSEVD